jgi:predicted PurR-regulated permease PerM
VGVEDRKQRRDAGNGDSARPATRAMDPLAQVARRAAQGAAALEGAGADAADGEDPSTALWAHAAHLAIVGIFLILLGALLKFAAAVIIPVTSAIIIGSIIGPIAEYGARHRVPPLLTAIVLVLLVTGLIYLTIITLTAPIASWIDRGPEIAQTLREKLHVLQGPLQALRNLYESVQGELAGSGTEAPPLKVQSESGGLLPGLIVAATPALTQILLFIGTLLFFLASRTGLRRRLVIVFGSREARLLALRILKDSERQLATYIGTVSVINLGIGLLTALAMFAVGLPNPEMWGLFAFILNYVPYLGPSTLTALLFVAGIATLPTLVGALVPPAIYVAINTLEGNVVTPSIVGRRLTLNPFLLFLSLAFWTWMWGPIGAFLAMPLMIVAMVVVQHLFPGDEVDLPG